VRLEDEGWSLTFEAAECRWCSEKISRDPSYWRTDEWYHESNRERECPDQATTRRRAAPQAGTRRVVPREDAESPAAA
jgi:hypothetical protein